MADKTRFPTLRRRDVLTAAAGVASVAMLDSRAEAEAVDEAISAAGVNPHSVMKGRTMDVRGRDGMYVRMPRLDMESKGNFLAGLYVWRLHTLEKTADVRIRQIMAENGIDDETDMPWEEAVALVEADPIVAMTGRARHSHQKLKYAMLQREYHKLADEFLGEMARADKLGPGTLELNPSMRLPKYTTHEIHSMPGGYVGDPFAGHMYHAGTDLGAYVDTNFQDGVHMRMAEAAAVPEDGKVRRILDLGTSIGQFATSMKRSYPDAEVWGIDVGGPMVRYAHMKAVDMGVEVNFAQRLCEDTGFPDEHFDIVTSNLLFHEVKKQAAVDIIRETYRVLRPGGVFSPTDANDPHQTAHAKFTWWYNYRWNHEDWFLDWMEVDFTGEMQRAGFKVVEVAKKRGLRPRWIGIKV